MRNTILFLICFFAFQFSNAQTTKDLLGKWKLESAEKNDQKLKPEELFDTNEVYQVFRQDKTFTSLVGKNKTEGTWEEDKKSKTILLKTKDGKKQPMKILSMNSKKRSMEVNGLILNYVKQE